MSKGTSTEVKRAAVAKRGAKTGGGKAPAAAVSAAVGQEAEGLGFSALTFRRRLGAWYRENARSLPWREAGDPYATWLSEIMLQQTRVTTVIDRYQEFLLRFPTIHDLAVAEEEDVLALWSGLGYYRRARMLHRGAQFVDREFKGKLPRSAMKLRTLPGVGEYTGAAIASIAFGESVAVLDGNVERVLLRVLGRPEEKGAKARALLVDAAQKLMPPASRRSSGENAPGDHNQAMMELGAMICLPRSPLCLQCPVMELCRTRGEHATGARAKMQSRTVAHLLALRKRGVATEVLLERRSGDASLMAGMMELPGLPVGATQGREPVLRLRHAITNTNYYVQIFSEGAVPKEGMKEAEVGPPLMEQILAAKGDMKWVTTTKLAQQPLTGLARKALQRLNLMALPQVTIDL
jgi:A/G-specific adenine glycosylase